VQEDLIQSIISDTSIVHRSMVLRQLHYPDTLRPVGKEVVILSTEEVVDLEVQILVTNWDMVEECMGRFAVVFDLGVVEHRVVTD
jgi:hypothetical protein